MAFSLDKVRVTEVGITTSPLKLEVLGVVYSSSAPGQGTQVRFRSNSCPDDVATAAKAFLEAIEASVSKDLGGDTPRTDPEPGVSVGSI